MCKISQGTRDSLKCSKWRLFSSSNATCSGAKGNSNLSHNVLLCACVSVTMGANNCWMCAYITWNRQDKIFNFYEACAVQAFAKKNSFKKPPPKKVSFVHDPESWFDPKRTAIFHLASLICIGLWMKFYKNVERSFVVLIANTQEV